MTNGAVVVKVGAEYLPPAAATAAEVVAKMRRLAPEAVTAEGAVMVAMAARAPTAGRLSFYTKILSMGTSMESRSLVQEVPEALAARPDKVDLEDAQAVTGPVPSKAIRALLEILAFPGHPARPAKSSFNWTQRKTNFVSYERERRKAPEVDRLAKWRSCRCRSLRGSHVCRFRMG